LVCLALALTGARAADDADASLALAWSTFLGSDQTASVRGVTADAEGNVYLVGGCSASGFPTTPGAYQEEFAEGYTNTFITKMSGAGEIIWSTLLTAGQGGDTYAYSIELDPAGNLVIGGRSAPGLPTTDTALQRDYRGVGEGGTVHGIQNSFVAKLSADGSELLWATYLGTGGCVRDVAIADNGDVFAITSYSPQEGSEPPPAHWFAGGFMEAPRGHNDVYVLRISGDGQRVVAGTYVSGSQWEHGSAGIALDAQDNVFVTFGTASPDMPTPNGFDQTLGGKRDMYLAKLSSDLSAMLFGTYLGGSGNEGANTHQVTVDPDGNPVVAHLTSSGDLFTSPGAIQPHMSSNGIYPDMYVVRVAADGSKILGATYLGSSGREHWPDGPSVDRFGNIYAVMTTPSTDLPVTEDAVQKHYGGGSDDVYLAKISADFSRLLYATYLGGDGPRGTGWDDSRDTVIDPHGNLYVVGDSASGGFPVKNALQPTLTGSQAGFVAKFLPTAAPQIRLWTRVTELEPPAELKLEASAEDPDGEVAKVNFFLNGELLGTASQLPYEWTLRDLPAGGYYAQAIATDDAGATTASHRMEINVRGKENVAPVIIEPAVANPNPIHHRPTNNSARPISMPHRNELSALAVDDAPEYNLRYYWRVVSKPKGAPDPAFSDNRTHSASTVEVDYARAGDYVFAVMVRDWQGDSAESEVSTRVRQACEGIRVAPAQPTVRAGESVALSGMALDQFDDPMTPQPTLKWEAKAGGEIGDDGVFHAGSEPGDFRIKVYSPDARFHRMVTVSVTE